MRKYATAFIAIALLVLSTPKALAQYVACTTIPSVVVSHFVTHNNDYGGHVNAHGSIRRRRSLLAEQQNAFQQATSFGSRLISI